MVFSSFTEATQALREVAAQVKHGRSVSFASHYFISLPVVGVLGLFYRLLCAHFCQPVAFFVMSSPRFQLPGIPYAL